MVHKFNFSGDPTQLYAMGKDAFMAAYRGKYQGDLNELWAEVVKAGKKEEKPDKTKPEKPDKTK